MRPLIFANLVLASVLSPIADGQSLRTIEEFGQQVQELRVGKTVVKLAPAAGANVYSIRVDDVEYLHQPESAERLPGVSCGVPILYPTPNRVRAGKFKFAGETVQFPLRKNQRWHIHGLVNRHPWKLLKSELRDDFASVTCFADFSEGAELHTLFPFAHQLVLTIEVREGSVKWSYMVNNQGKKPVPFGFALHPYITYQGMRSETFLTIPATHMMKSEDRMPTGELIAADELDFPLGKPMTLEGKSFDDVFWGMDTKRPTAIEFRDVRRKIEISTSEHFTHLVVWTPDRNYFGIESQTCSTDAHNLHAAGKEGEAHLQICPPGETMSAWVEYKFTSN